MSKKVMWTILSILPNNVLRLIRVGNIIGLALAAVCSLGPGEAAAQYCPDTPTLNLPRGEPNIGIEVRDKDGNLRDIRFTEAQLRRLYSYNPRLQLRDTPVYCDYSHSDEDNDRVVFVRNPRIFITDEYDIDPGIYARHAGSGDLSVYVHALGPTPRDGAIHPNPLDYGNHAVRSRGVDGFYNGDMLHGVHAEHTGEGRVGIDFRDLSLSTTGNYAYGIFAKQAGGYTFENGMSRRKRGAVIINVIETDRDRGSRVRPLIATRGDYADVIRAEYTAAAAYGHIRVEVRGYTIAAGGIVPTDETALRPVYSVGGNEEDPTDLTGSLPLLPTLFEGTVRPARPRVAFFRGVSSEESRGIYAEHQGRGDIRIFTTDSIIMTWGENSAGIYGTHTGRKLTVPERPIRVVAGTTAMSVTTGGGEVKIDVRGGSIVTEGESSHGVWGLHRGVGGVDIDLTGASVATVGPHARGVFGWIRRCLGTIDSTQCDVERARNTLIEGSGEGDIAIDVTGGSSIVTAGRSAYAVQARHENKGDIAIRLTGSTTAMTRATTKGEGAYGVFADHRGTEGNVAVTLNAASIVTEGNGASALLASRAGGTGNVAVTVAGSTVEMMGGDASGVAGVHTGTRNLAIDVQGGSITATGTDTNGVYGLHTGSGNVDVDVRNSSIAVTGTGVLGVHTGTGDLAIDVQGGSITTTGPDANTQYATGVYGTHTGSGTLAINVRGASVTARGAGGGDGIRARISNEDDVTVSVTVDQDSSVRGARFGVRVFVEGTDGTTGGTGAGVRSDGLGAVMVAGMDSAVPSTHEERHFQVTNHGTITGGEVGVRLEPGGSVVNRGRITGKIGVQAGGGSTVENSGAIISTDGADGTSIHFDPGNNVLTLLPGTNIVGDRVQGVCGEGDTLDFSRVSPAAIGSLICINDDGTPGDEFTLLRPQGKGRLIRIGETVYSMDTTAFALTDDMLSDLTGSIHAAVVGNGLQAHAGEGDPARNRVWAAPFGGAREQNGPGWLEDGTHYFGGGMLGADWGTATRVGLFVGGSVGQLDVRRMMGDRRTIDMQTVFGGVYARQDLGDVRLDARVVMGKMDHDSTRRGGRQGAANVEYTSIFLSPEVGAATRIQLMSRLQATPRVRVRYAGLFTEGFRESSIGLSRYDVQFAKRDVHVLEARGEMGIPIALHAGGRIEPRVGVEGRWLAAGDTIDVTFLNGRSRVVDVGGDQIVGTGTVGVGMVLPVADATALVGNFDGAYTTEEAWRATGYLGLVYSF